MAQGFGIRSEYYVESRNGLDISNENRCPRSQASTLALVEIVQAVRY